MGVMTEGLEGKVAIVTGAASGIGRETALEFCEAGAKVVVADIDEEKSRETLDLIKKRKGEAIYVRCDVSKISDIDTLVLKTLSEYNKIDILVNNCAYFVVSNILDTSEEQWNRSIDVNLKGTFFMCRAVIPAMLKQKGGKIINISSAVALAGIQNMGAYTASKGGVVSLTRQLAIEFIDKNINVNCVCPGTIDTPILKPYTVDDAVKQAIVNLQPRKRLGQPQDIARVILFLSSSAADFVNGAVISADDGVIAKMCTA